MTTLFTTGTTITSTWLNDTDTKVQTTLPTTIAAEVSRATTAEGLLAPKDSPTFTGTPTLPTGTIAITQTPYNNSTKVATTAYVDAQQTYPFRNRIINDFSVSQINANTLVTTGIATDTIVMDAWIVNSATAAVTAGRSQDATGLPSGFFNNLKIAGAASNTNVTAKSRMESNTMQGMASKQIATTFYMYQNSGSAMSGVTVKLFCPTTTADTFSAVTQEGSTVTVSISSGVLTPVTAMITLGASNVARGLEVQISTNAAVLSGVTVYISPVQVEAVPTGATQGTAYEVLPYATQLARCQRYYEKSFDVGTVPVQNSGTDAGAFWCFTNTSASSANIITYIPFKVPKRTTGCTVTTYNPTQANANWRCSGDSADANVTVSTVSENGFKILATTLLSSNSARIHWTASAPL